MQPGNSIVRKLHALIAQCHNQLEQHDEALAACRNGRAHYPDDIELLFQEGMVRRNLGDLHGAKACWEQVLATPAGKHFASMNIGISGYLTRHNLATVYHELKQYADAEREWRAILGERPNYEAAWVGLSEVFLARAQWEGAEKALRAVLTIDPANKEAEHNLSCLLEQRPPS